MRTLTGMLAVVGMSIAASAQEAAGSKSLFRPCAEVLSADELEAARDQVSVGSVESANCLRLTDKEFVVFTGGGILTTRFHYCGARRVPACETEPFRPYSFDVEREFTGANGKRFMLWKTSRYQRGVFVHGYGIASLVPRSVESRGFDVYPLAGGAIHRGEDSTDSDPCENLGDQATEISGYELLNESTREVELRFSERIVDCKTREETLRVKRYRSRNGVFELVP